jgi:hypothetical protein
MLLPIFFHRSVSARSQAAGKLVQIGKNIYDVQHFDAFLTHCILMFFSHIAHDTWHETFADEL